MASFERLPRTTEPYGTGNWICFREHVHPNLNGYGLSAVGPLRFPTFGFYMLDLVGHWGLMEPLVRIGILDAENEGGPAFWRWDFWNSKMRAEIQRLERQQWERKRAEAIARWGEGAG